MPSFEPSSGYPTASPIVPMRANIAVNLRNVPERPMTEREYTKFLELLLKFLTRYTSQSMVRDVSTFRLYVFITLLVSEP